MMAWTQHLATFARLVLSVIVVVEEDVLKDRSDSLLDLNS